LVTAAQAGLAVTVAQAESDVLLLRQMHSVMAEVAQQAQLVEVTSV
jgi:hypothetical protein